MSPKSVTVQTIIDDVVARLPREAIARLTIDASPALPSLFLPRSGLTQAALSLVTNALDATPSSGQSPVLVRVAAASDSLAFIVSDAGPGMSPDVLRRAGEPFFTTKDPGRGCGLGLFLTRVFAERIGGTLSLESDNGTTATLLVPLRAQTAEAVR